MARTNGLSHRDREEKPAVLEEEPGLPLPCHLLYPVAYSHTPTWTSVYSFILGALPSLRLPLQTGALELQVPGSHVDPRDRHSQGLQPSQEVAHKFTTLSPPLGRRWPEA